VNLMQNWTFKATPVLVEALSEKWSGTYEVKMLMGDEYLSIGEEMMDDLRKSKKADEEVKPEDLKKSDFNMRLLYKAVLHNGKPLKKPIPAKLIDLLMPLVIRRNTMSLAERREDFLECTTENPVEASTSGT